MRLLLFLLSIFLLSPSISSGLSAKNKPTGNYEYSLKKYKGKQNVLLVFAPTKKNSEFLKQSEILKEQFKFLNERKTALFFVLEGDNGRADNLKLRDSDAKDLRKQFNVKDGSFLVVAVDKTGKTVGKKTLPQSLDELKKFLKP